MVRPEFARDLARLVAHVHGDDQARAAQAGDLQALQSHAALAEDHHRVRHPQLGRLDRRHAVAERLQTGRLAVGDAVVHLDEGDFRQTSAFREAAGQVEADDRSLAAEVAALGAAERALPARQLGPRRHAVAGSKPADARSDFEDAGAEFVAEELDGGLRFQPALDAVVGQRRDSLGELCFGDARLHAERFDQDVPRTTDGFGNVVEPHVVEAVESPGFHGSILPSG